MRPELLSWLACPTDGAAPLELIATAQTGLDEVEAGCLACPRCGRAYPIEGGIPRLLPDPATLPPEEWRQKERERRQRDREASYYDRNLLLGWLGRWEIPTTLRALSPQAEESLLEVGCGTGRFTARIASRCRQVVAVDFSAESLRVARSRIASPSVHFIQGDAGRLPLREGVADRALSCQMLEHLPTPGARQTAVAQVARVLRPGGTFAVSAYWHSPFARLFGRKEGHHNDAIYFYRFSRREFVELLEPYFEVETLTTRLIYVLLARAVRRTNEWLPSRQPPSIESGETRAAPIGYPRESV